MKKPKVYMVATAHLDTVWNWTLEDTVNKFLPAMLEENFALLDRFDRYRFNFEGAYRYDLIKEFYPEAYEKLKEYIAAGRWFVAGSSWENGDVVTPAPETLMRNILYGNRFFEKEFGKRSNDIFLPDCFGFPCTLPTVMRHMGLKAFSSQKLTWNEGRTPPFHVGIWQGIDGSEVVAALNPGAYTSKLKESPASDEALFANTAALPLQRDLRYYGTGDQGGSPGEDSARLVHEAAATDGLNEVIPAYAGQLADELTPEERACLPRTNEELLMVTHGVGSYTSVAPTKRFHRSNERKADFAERANVFAAWLGAADYPKARLTKAWRDFIRHEFHDDLTGTSVLRAYRETFHDDIVVNNVLDGEIAAALTAIAANVDTGTGGGEKLVVFNPAAYDRSELAEATLFFANGAPAAVRVFDCGAHEVPSQIVSRKGDAATILFYAEVPSQGYAVYRVLPAGKPFENTALSVTAHALENERLRVTIDENGEIASLFDKENGRELLSAPIRFEILKNGYRNYGAWEIGWEDLTAPPEKTVGGAHETRVLLDGAARVSLEITRVSGTSRFRQVLSLDVFGDRLNVYNDISWTESCSLLKAAFPLAVQSETAVYDAGLGSVERGDRTPDKYEVPVHTWANVYDKDQDYSVTILNDCKYGMDKCGGTLRLTCIHTPANRFMDRTRQDLQDFGQNVFSFAVSGGRGDFRKTGAHRQGTLFNAPLAVCRTGSHAGMLPPAYAFLRLDNPAVSVLAVKQAEDSDEIVVRLSETAGKPAAGVFTLGEGIDAAREVNGYEEPVGPAEIAEGGVRFTLSPFAPKTFAVRLKKPAGEVFRDRFTALELAGTLPFTSGDDERGAYGPGKEKTTVPRPLIGDGLTAAGIPFCFTQKEGQLFYTVPAGESVPLPQDAAALHLLAARCDGDGTYTILIDGAPYAFGVQDFADDVGGWEQYGAKHFGFIREDRVAFCASHTHDVTGDRVYGRFNWYLYTVRLPHGAKTVVLPADGGMMLAAATLRCTADRRRESGIVSDLALHKAQKRPHAVRTDGQAGDGTYRAGEPVHLVYTGAPGQVRWRLSDGRALTGMSAAFDMPDADVDVWVAATPYPYAAGKVRQVLANAASEGHPASALTDGDPATRWMAAVNGPATVLADLGETRRLSHLVLRHAGSAGADQTLNTYVYAVRYLAGGRWQPLVRCHGNILPVTQHDFDEIETRFLEIRIEIPTRNGNDAHASLSGIEVYADRPYPVCPEEPVTAYDLPGEELKNAEILFKGACKRGETVRFPHKAVVSAWRAEGTASAAIRLNGATDEGKDAVTPGTVERLLIPAETDALTLEAFSAETETVCLTVYGKSLALTPLTRFAADECCGTRNPLAEVRPHGVMYLPVCPEQGHDLYGFPAVLPAGDVTLAMKVRIPPEAEAQAADSTPLFEFNPVFPNTEIHGKTLTLGDYRAAPADGDGWRVLSDSFENPAAGGTEGRIVNFRNLPLEVLDFTFFGGKR
ncbi:MAG: discoidin domain-containing protein [Clostridia bacterium]|nr:discoidin domain-containing protein [Clostridia bacterium]